MAEKAVNSFITQLNGAIGAAASPILVDAAAPGGLQVGEFRILIHDPAIPADDEICIVTSGQDTTSWAVTRGAEGTTARAHPDNAQVIHVLTDASFDLLVQQVVDADSRMTNARTPTGAAGGVLGGTYPNPGFASDMATQAELDAHVNDTSAAHAASAIGFTPTGLLAATDVQAAIVELLSELGFRRADAGGNSGNAPAPLATNGDPLVVFRNLILNPSVNGGTVAVTVTGLALNKPQLVFIVGAQHATTFAGTLTVDDGSGAQPVPIPQTASAPFALMLVWDGTDSYVQAIGSPPDATATVKGLIQLAGDLTGTAASPQLAAGVVALAEIAASLKPSGTAATTDESLRRLGTAASHAAAGDDSRFPTTGQKNALAGANGTPGTGNEYLTKQTAGAASGVAQLDAGSKVPQAQLGTGSGGLGGKFLADDQTFKTPAAGGSSFGGICPLHSGRAYLPGTGQPPSGSITRVGGYAQAIPFVAGQSKSLDKLYIEATGTVPTAGTHYRAEIRTDGGGFPSNTVVTNSDTGVSASWLLDTNGVKTFTYPAGSRPALIAGTLYWLILWQVETPATNATMKGWGSSFGSPLAQADITNLGIAMGVSMSDATKWNTGATPTNTTSGDWAVATNLAGSALQAA